MASAARPGMPLFYNDIVPLSSQTHGEWRARNTDTAPFLSNVHAIPLTVDEFAVAHRHYPIVFSAGTNSVPLALMGLNEGVNVYVDDEGRLKENVYIPAYVRRYPFILARLREGDDKMSLCFDPASGAIGPFDDGDRLFDGSQPSERIKAVLGFCEEYEAAWHRTANFMKEIVDAKLVIDGEVSIQTETDQPPYIYRGFQMVSEDAVRELRGDVCRKMIQSGILPLIYAHLFSLPLIREVFGRQHAQGKVPPLEGLPT